MNLGIATRKSQITDVVLLAAAVLLGLAATNLATAWFGSSANATSAVSAGRVTITPGGEVSYTANDVEPGWSDNFTVDVDNDSSTAVDLRMYASTNGSLASVLNVRVRRNGSEIYDGSASGLPSSWSAADSTRTSGNPTYRFDLSLPDELDRAYENTGASLTFTFEGRS